LPNTLATIYGISFLSLDTDEGNWIWIFLSLIISTAFGTMLVYLFVRKIWTYLSEGNMNIKE